MSFAKNLILLHALSPVLINLLIVIASFIISVLLLALYKYVQRKIHRKEGVAHYEMAGMSQQLDKLLEERKINAELINSLPSAYLVSDLPEKMKQGKSYKINISVTFTEDQKSNILPDSMIKLGHYVEACLEEEFYEGNSFKIRGMGTINKKLPLFNIPEDDAFKQIIWKGRITPVQSGAQTVFMRINSYYPGQDDLLDGNNKEQTVSVQKNVFFALFRNLNKFAEKNQMWIKLTGGTVVISAIIKHLLNTIFGI